MSPQPAQVPEAELREAYLANARVRIASAVARIAAFGLLGFLIGSLATLADRDKESIFDLARSTLEVARPGPGYLAGPLLIAIALPVLQRGRPPFAWTRHYRARVAIAVGLWAIGLVVLFAGNASLSSAYEIKTGTYIAATLLAAGLVATAAMWPAGLQTARVAKGRAGQLPTVVPVAAAGAAPAPAPAVAEVPPAAPAASRQGMYVVLAVLAGLVILGSVGYLAVVRPMQEHKSDAKAALRDTQSLVDRSIVVSRRARRDARRAISRGPQTRRVAVAELNQVISLRKRAIKRLAAVDKLDFPNSRTYKRAAATWSSVISSSIDSARDARGSLTDRQLTQPNAIARQALATILVGQTEFMAKYDRLLQSTDRRVIRDLV